jgi:DNA topoisomerase-1
MLPPLEINQKLNLNQMKALERFTRPAARYTEASLVKKLEEMGIGRPSTYAPTISTIQKRGYVEKESREGRERPLRELLLEKGTVNKKIITENTGAEKNKLFPTDIAMIVNDFLVNYFPNVTNYSFTANVEQEFDEIAQGKKQWAKMIENFYGTFHEKVETTEAVDRSAVNTSRELGIDPASGKKIIVRLGRFGPLAQIGEASEDGSEKPKFASLRKGQLLETITLEEALDLFKLPREVGNFEDKAMVVAIGRFGPYIRHDSKFYSLTKEDDPYTIDENRCITIIENKRKADAEKEIKVFEENPDVKILNGRWGPYISALNKNVKIPKDRDPKSLTLAECLDLAEKAPEKKGRFGKAKAAEKTPAKKTVTKKTTAKKTAGKKPGRAAVKKKKE